MLGVKLFVWTRLKKLNILFLDWLQWPVGERYDGLQHHVCKCFFSDITFHFFKGIFWKSSIFSICLFSVLHSGTPILRKLEFISCWVRKCTFEWNPKEWVWSTVQYFLEPFRQTIVMWWAPQGSIVFRRSLKKECII